MLLNCGIGSIVPSSVDPAIPTTAAVSLEIFSSTQSISMQ